MKQSNSDVLIATMSEDDWPHALEPAWAIQLLARVGPCDCQGSPSQWSTSEEVTNRERLSLELTPDEYDHVRSDMGPSVMLKDLAPLFAWSLKEALESKPPGTIIHEMQLYFCNSKTQPAEDEPNLKLVVCLGRI